MPRIFRWNHPLVWPLNHQFYSNPKLDDENYPLSWSGVHDVFLSNELGSQWIDIYFILFHFISLNISWACHLLGKFSNRYWYIYIYTHIYIYTCEWIYLLYPNTNDCQPSHVQVRVVYRRLTRHRSSGPSLAIAGWRRWRPAENMGVVSTKTWEYYLGYNQPIWFKDLFEYLLGFAAWTAIFRNLGLRIRPLSSDNLLSQVLDHHWIWSVAPCEPSAGQNLSTSETQISGLSFQWAIPFWAKISRVPTCFFSIAACWSPTHQIALEKITQWSAGFGHAVLLLSDGERIEIHNATSQLRRMEWHTPMFDHIVWTCPCRPCNMDIPPRQGEVLVARVGLFSLGCWHRSCSCLACVCATLHLGSPAWLLVLCRSRHMFAHLSCLFLGLPCFPPFCLGLITGGSLVLCSGFCPVDWVRALTWLVPVFTCAARLESFTHAPRFLRAAFIQCSSGVMAVLLPSEKIDMANATFCRQSREFATLAIWQCARDLALQLELVSEDDAVELICSSLAGLERCRLTVHGVESAWESHIFGLLANWMRSSQISSSFCQMGSCWPKSARQIQRPRLLQTPLTQ